MRNYIVLALGLCAVSPSSASAVTLEEAFQSARQKNESLKQSEERVVQAEEQLNAYKGALYPSIRFGVDYQLQPLPNDPIAASFSPRHQTTVLLEGKQPLFKGFREFAVLREKKHSNAAESANQQSTWLRLYQDIATAFLGALSAEQDLHNLEGQLSIYQLRVNELKSRTRRGESSATELLSTQSTYVRLQAETRLVKGQINASRENFAYLTGLPRDAKLQNPRLLDFEKRRPDLDLGKYLARIDQRPDVRAALEQSMAADEQVSVNRGAHWFTLDAIGHYYFKRPGFLSDLNWDVGVSLSLPLYSGGTTQAGVREAVSKRKSAELEVVRARRAAEQEIRTLHENLMARLEHLDLLKNSAEIAQKNADVSQRDYRRGLLRNIDVQVALGDFRDVQRSYDQSRFAAQLDFLKLEAAAALRSLDPEGTTTP